MPVRRKRLRLQGQQGQLNEAEWGAMNDEIMNEVERAVEFAKASAFPKPEAALDDVFAD